LGVSEPAGRGSRLITRWESLPVGVQAPVAFVPFVVVLFLLNLAVFNQPLWRSILYGVIEGAVLTAMLLAATASERRKRGSNDPNG
jgi:hypothetical protein